MHKFKAMIFLLIMFFAITFFEGCATVPIKLSEERTMRNPHIFFKGDVPNGLRDKLPLWIKCVSEKEANWVIE